VSTSAEFKTNNRPEIRKGTAADQELRNISVKIKDSLTAISIRFEVLDNAPEDKRVEFVQDIIISLEEINKQATILYNLPK